MYWSAAMSLKAPSRDKSTTNNYGSFRPASSSRASSLTSCGSSSNVRIPQSIPEHQCVLQFTSPRLQHFEEHKLAELYERECDASKTTTTTTTVTVTASKALQLLLLASRKLDAYSSATAPSTASTDSNSSSDEDKPSAFAYTAIALPDDAAAALNGSFASKAAQEMVAAAAQAAANDDDSEQLNYWMLERERLRAKRERRHLLAKHAAAVGSAVNDNEGEPAPAWRTAAIMCSVPLLLVLAFALVVLLSGDGSASATAATVGSSNAHAPSAWEYLVRTVTGEASAASSAAARHAALRGGVSGAA